MPEALIRPELVQLGAAPADKTAAIRQAGRLQATASDIFYPKRVRTSFFCGLPERLKISNRSA